jgi:hypothetical protein
MSQHHAFVVFLLLLVTAVPLCNFIASQHFFILVAFTSWKPQNDIGHVQWSYAHTVSGKRISTSVVLH